MAGLRIGMRLATIEVSNNFTTTTKGPTGNPFDPGLIPGPGPPLYRVATGSFEVRGRVEGVP